ncbi:MAG: NAD(P)-dependent dehydrogenase (short-subunit alcohol dehydrogenase family) [Halocynthiibacter sp.]|jgi:NAD(P)-dependent dehydrogenase (short-subunit alcohol dehydrogenase family)
MDELQGKTVLITGASRGIGEAAAHIFAQAGANVALCARSNDAISALAAKINEETGAKRAIAIPCDVSKYADVEAAINEAAKTFGGLDVLINNAGVIEPISHLSISDPESWSHAIDINLKGVYYGMRAALPIMKAAGGGSVLTVSSGAAHGPMEAWSHYCSSKAGAAMLTRMLDLEERANGIRAIGLSPGTVATKMQREIKVSALNPVSNLEWEDHIPPEWPAKALAWMACSKSDAYLGQEISLRDESIRAVLGLSS